MPTLPPPPAAFAFGSADATAEGAPNATEAAGVPKVKEAGAGDAGDAGAGGGAGAAVKAGVAAGAPCEAPRRRSKVSALLSLVVTAVGIPRRNTDAVNVLLV